MLSSVIMAGARVRWFVYATHCVMGSWKQTDIYVMLLNCLYDRKSSNYYVAAWSVLVCVHMLMPLEARPLRLVRSCQVSWLLNCSPDSPLNVGTVCRDRWSRGREGDLLLLLCCFVDEKLEESVHNILSTPLVLITQQEMSSVKSGGRFYWG